MPGTILCTRNTNNSAQNKSLTFTETIFVVEEDISKILKQIFNILCVRNRKKSPLYLLCTSLSLNSFLQVTTKHIPSLLRLQSGVTRLIREVTL